MVQWIFYHYHHNCDWLYQEQLATPHRELELIEMFEYDPKCFGNYSEKWARPLSEWAFNACLREKYIIKSATLENQFYFSEKCIIKKRGRPRKE
ncbi:MAG: hypothetical protein IJJ56_06975 [Prevotella sp.]|nr:hypothetical protein [Prevotella sp.]